ncbi:hypothetical protein HDU96_005297 [Phlyctochytrium bullatum]|nr:hypothetical protein HDU96_005297 [Phlyctochytrium bullatum]
MPTPALAIEIAETAPFTGRTDGSISSPAPTMVSPRSRRHFFFALALALMIITLFFVAPFAGFTSEGSPFGSLRRRTENRPEPLRFKPDGKFRIVQFTDLHFGENAWEDWGPEQDVNSTRVMKSVLEAEKPDFVVFTGDQITGENIIAHNVSRYVQQLLQPVVEKRIDFATIFGNHDHASNLFTAHDLLHAEMKYDDLSRTLFGPRDVNGLGNYHLRLYPPAGKEDPKQKRKPAVVLWFFDTNGNASSKVEPNWVHADQVAWFRNQSAEIYERYGPVPSLAFFHIPLMATAQNNVRKDFDQVCKGYHDEPGLIAVQDGDEGFGAALANSPTPILAAFSGHDHGTGWCCPGPKGSVWEKITFCQNKHSGYGGYSRHGWTKGARVIELDFPNITSWSTWIRLEDKSVVYPIQF